MKGFTLWFTGPSGSGKSTLAAEVESVLLERGMKVELLDASAHDWIVPGEPSAPPPEVEAHLRRLGRICQILTRNDVAVIVAAVSASRGVREENRALIGRFVEVYCRAEPQTLDARGYEPPTAPEVVLDTGHQSVEKCVAEILRALEGAGYIPRTPESDYSHDEEKQIADRLTDLGYL